MRIHVYSNINLRYFEFANPIDEQVPDCDLIVVAGSISDSIKRSLLFQETISVISNTPLIVNYSLTEFSKGDFYYDNVCATTVRYQMTKDTNCYYNHDSDIKLDNPAVDVLAISGWPYIESEEELAISPLRKYVYKVVWNNMLYNEKNELIGHIQHNTLTREEINNLHNADRKRIENWLDQSITTPRLLVLGGNFKQLLAGFDLTGVTVITTADAFIDCEFQNGRLYSNPGSGQIARSNILTV